MNRFLISILIFLSSFSFAKDSVMSQYVHDGWSISLKNEWYSDNDENLVSFYDPQGHGVLQVSSYTKNTLVTESDLKELAKEHIEAGARFKSYEQSGSQVITLAFGFDGSFWQYWYISIGSSALVVTYNCAEEDRNIEIESVKSMVSTIKAT